MKTLLALREVVQPLESVAHVARLIQPAGILEPALRLALALAPLATVGQTLGARAGEQP